MHFPQTAFSIDGSFTVIDKNNDDDVSMGQTEKISEMDIEKIKAMYCEDIFNSEVEATVYNALQDFFFGE